MKHRSISQDIGVQFQSASWRRADAVDCPFVRYYSSDTSPASIWQYSPDNDNISLTVVIPTFDAYRHGYFLKLLAQIEIQDFQDFELIVVRGDPRQGRAINRGAALARGKYLLTLDDDTALPDAETFGKLVAVMEANPGIGIAGGNNVIPLDSTPFVRKVMQQIPRRSWEPVQTIKDSDLAEHPCMIMRTKEFREVGGENELIPRGLDPYLREAFRRKGKRVVVVPGVIYHHLPPKDLLRLLIQFYRNGRQASYTNRKYPEWIIETPIGHDLFKTRVPFFQRVLRFPIHLIYSLIRGKPIWFLCEIFYALGFANDFIFKIESQ